MRRAFFVLVLLRAEALNINELMQQGSEIDAELIEQGWVPPPPLRDPNSDVPMSESERKQLEENMNFPSCQV
jgi:hypothetical protein